MRNLFAASLLTMTLLAGTAHAGPGQYCPPPPPPVCPPTTPTIPTTPTTPTTPVSEPASLAIAALGGAAVMFLVRRRREK